MNFRVKQEAHPNYKKQHQRYGTIPHRARQLLDKSKGERPNDNRELLYHVIKAEVEVLSLVLRINKLKFTVSRSIPTYCLAPYLFFLGSYFP